MGEKERETERERAFGESSFELIFSNVRRLAMTAERQCENLLTTSDVVRSVKIDSRDGGEKADLKRSTRRSTRKRRLLFRAIR